MSNDETYTYPLSFYVTVIILIVFAAVMMIILPSIVNCCIDGPTVAECSKICELGLDNLAFDNEDGRIIDNMCECHSEFNETINDFEYVWIKWNGGSCK